MGRVRLPREAVKGFLNLFKLLPIADCQLPILGKGIQADSNKSASGNWQSAMTSVIVRAH